MERKGSSEKFQPRMVASFSKIQLLNVFLWSEKNVTQTGPSFTQDFLRVLETAELDEKGESMNEKAKNRLKYGEKVISDLLSHGHHLDQIQGLVTVWQLAPDGKDVEIRWELNKNNSNQRQRRYY